MRNSLKKGDTITTIGGIVGKIVIGHRSTIVIETSEDRVRMELTKWAVSTMGVQVQRAEPKRREKKDRRMTAEEKRKLRGSPKEGDPAG